MTPHRHSLYYFLLLSVAVHAVLLTLFSPKLEWAGDSGGISVHLVEAQRQSNSTPSAATIKAKASRVSSHATTAPDLRQLANAAERQQTQPAVTSSAETQPSSDEGVEDGFRPAILTQLNQQLEQHFYYPLLARKQGWQGRVLVDFYVTNSGYIEDIHIAESSGFKTLDHAAIRSLKRIKRLVFSGNMLATPFRIAISLPVIYQLERG